MSTERATIEKRAESYRDYPIELKASVIAAIEANGGNVLATSKLFNIPRDTVNYWWNNSDRFVELKHPSSQNLADKLEDIAVSYADSLASHDQSVVAANDKASIITKMVQNFQLLRGQPTSITESVERNELTVILQTCLTGALSLPDVIDVEPVEPEE